ncbi:hypothetical protein F4694_004373 [Bacillus niacini]|uniref:Uncharacterized protein n=1 Tax=Neobacillus niacini TaxID=86668 RepID=A0A852TFL5_9BACI|nr:hypothetical protein [Neobacillus niacini]
MINFYTIRGQKEKEKEKEKEKQQEVLLKKIEENPNRCVIVISFHKRFSRP